MSDQKRPQIDSPAIDSPNRVGRPETAESLSAAKSEGRAAPSSAVAAPHPASPTPPARTPRVGHDLWNGPLEWFQFEARKANPDATKESWMVSECNHPRCLAHTTPYTPEPLDYRSGICIYCGLSANATDHFVPSARGDELRVWTAPACRECLSGVASTMYRADDSVARRRLAAHDHIRFVFARTLALPVWSEKDLEEMGPNLRSTIDVGQELARAIRLRLAWPPASYDDAANAVLAAGTRPPRYTHHLIDI